MGRPYHSIILFRTCFALLYASVVLYLNSFDRSFKINFYNLVCQIIVYQIFYFDMNEDNFLYRVDNTTIFK